VTSSQAPVETFLSAKTPDEIAFLIIGRPYSSLQKLIYPVPRYKTFTIKKKRGGDRTIEAPGLKLLVIQQRLAKLIASVVSPRPSAHGFQKDRSIVTNARQHCSPQKRFIFNIDLKEFFPSITFPRVKGLFASAPFGFPPNVAVILAHLCCYRGRLPQGAPTSPLISNLICRPLDYKMQVLAKDCRATYTRYCDDITFSFTVTSTKYLPDRIVKLDGSAYSVGMSLSDIIADEGNVP